MFKICVLLLLLFVFFSDSFAQYPILNSSNNLIYSRQIGEDFSLFIPDTAIQILFNPARASEFNSEFIYGTYFSNTNLYRYSDNNIYSRMGNIVIYDTGNPIDIRSSYRIFPSYSSISPTIALTTLMDINNSKWLLTFSNGISNSDQENYDNQISEDTYDDYYRYTMRDIKYINKYKFNTNALQLTKVHNNYSIGIFITYNNSEISGEEISTTKYESIYTLTKRYDQYDNKENNSNSGNQLQIGASFSIDGKNWDNIVKISYQLSDFKYDAKQTYSVASIDSFASDTLFSSWDINTGQSYKNRIIDLNSKPQYYQIYNYFQQKTNWFSENENIFMKINAAYSNTKYNYKSNLIDNFQLTINDTISGVDSMQLDAIGSIKTENYWIQFSAGYVIRFTFDDIQFLLGTNPYYYYLKLNDIFTSQRSQTIISQNYFLNRKRELNIYAIRLPIYIHYSPESWIQFYGGLVYSYGYSDELNEEIPLFDDQITNTNPITELITKSKSCNSGSSKSKFLGINLKHKSGLRFQVAFNRDIFDISRWNFSLGYHF